MPESLEHTQDPSTLARLTEVADRAKSLRLSDNTRRAYKGDWERFDEFCTENHLEPVPADPATVRAYVAHMSTQIDHDGHWRYKASSISRAVAAINAVHRSLGHPRASNEDVNDTINGVRRARKEQIDRKHPLLLTEIRHMIARMDHHLWPTGMAAARDTAVILLGFGSAARRSEVAALKLRNMTINEDGLIITISQSKSDQEGAGATLAIPRGNSELTCAVCAWMHWNRLRHLTTRPERMMALFQRGHSPHWEHICYDEPDIKPDNPDAPAFVSVNRAGGLGDGHLSGNALNMIVKRRVDDLGLNPDKYGFHSLRSGFVTQARRNGADTRAVRRQTRHKSDDMVNAYDRDFAPLIGNAVTELGL